MKFSCIKCTTVWYKTPNAALKYYNCPTCSERTRYDTRRFKSIVENEGNSNVIVIGNYINIDTSIECLCRKCNKRFWGNPYNLLNGTGCSYCGSQAGGNKTRFSQEQFEEKLLRTHPQFEVIGKYVNNVTPIKVRCKLCNCICTPLPSNLTKTNLYKNGCPKCCSSKGEVKIMNYLKLNNIIFNTQMKYDGLYGIKGGKLSYDFYIPSHNKLIEFQGIQHDKPVEEFGGEEQFVIQKEHDKRKREYALNHNIGLLEIWYYEIDNVEKY